MRYWLVLLCVSAAYSLECPEHCTCAVSDLLTYSCGHLTVRARDDGYMEVDCAGGPWQCDLIPPVSIGHARLKRLEVTACDAPLNNTEHEGWKCALTAAGAVGTEVVAVRGPLAPLTPSMMAGIDATTLFMHASTGDQKSLPIPVITSTPSLRIVRLLSLSSPPLSSDLFASSPPLTKLEIAMSGVKDLPSRAFYGLNALEVLSLWGNDIGAIDVDAFKGLDSLQQLILNNNPLTLIPTGALSHTARLRRLCLMNTRLMAVHDDTLQGLDQLLEVKLQNLSPLTLSPHAFSHLPSLTSLSLPSSHISSLPPEVLLNSTNIVNLTLSANQIELIPDGVFSNLTKLERLDLSGNRIKVISRAMFSKLISLVELNLDGNLIEVLPDRVFSGVPLTSVMLSRNRISHISWLSFVGANTIKRLWLAHNRLRGWGGEGEGDVSSPFNMLSSLEELSLRNNSISVVCSDWRFALLALRKLDLSYNAFTDLTVTDLQFIPRDSWSVVVDFRHNNISTVSPYSLYTAASPAATILLDYNPFHCECNLYYFIRQLSDKQYSVQNAACASPPAMKNRKLTSLNVKDITCAVENVSRECDCLIRPVNMNIECDCTNLTSLPDPKENMVDSVSLRLRKLPTNFDRLPEYVRALNLSNLGLSKIPKIPETVKFLDLTRNELRKIPLELFNGNLSLKLSGNPLTCDCWTVNDLIIVNENSKYIQDYNNMTCDPYKKLSNIEPYSLCSVYRSSVAGTLFAAILIFFAVVVATLYYYRIEIQVYMYSKKICLCMLPRETHDFEKAYDVFVSFASEDEKFVCKEILPNLEGKYSLHVQDRDWQAGDTIPTQIRQSIELSSRTIVILTQNFLKSLWASEELKLLHSHAANDKKVRAIVVLKDEIELDKDLKTYLSLATKIKHKDRMFWNKLFYALPRKDMYKSLMDKNQFLRGMSQFDDKNLYIGKNHYIGSQNQYEGKNHVGENLFVGKNGVPTWCDSLNVVVNGEGKLVNKGFTE